MNTRARAIKQERRRTNNTNEEQCAQTSVLLNAMLPLSSSLCNAPNFPSLFKNHDPPYISHLKISYMPPLFFSRLPPLEYSLTHFSSTNPNSPWRAKLSIPSLPRGKQF